MIILFCSRTEWVARLCADPFSHELPPGRADPDRADPSGLGGSRGSVPAQVEAHPHLAAQRTQVQTHPKEPGQCESGGAADGQRHLRRRLPQTDTQSATAEPQKDADYAEY